MTRDEEIIAEAQKHGLNCMSRINYQDGFIEGAKWADKTMIEKACRWLEHQEEMIGVSFEEDLERRMGIESHLSIVCKLMAKYGNDFSLAEIKTKL